MSALTPHKFHGIQLALNSTFDNFVVENLVADPQVSDAIPLAPARAWFNTTQNAWKYCDVDGTGALRINTLGSAEALAAAVASLTSQITTLSTGGSAALTAEQTRATTAEATLTTGLAQEVSDRTNADSTEATARVAGDATVAQNAATADAATAANASAPLSSEATIRANADTALGARDDAIQTELNQVQVSVGLTSTGAYVAPANTTYLGGSLTILNADVLLDTALTGEVARATAAEATLTSNLSTEEAARIAGDANLQTQLTAYVNAQVTAVNNTEAAEAARAIAAEAAISTILSATDNSVGLNADGTLPAITGTTYINGVSNVIAAEKLLDTAIANAVTALAAETVARTNADTAQTTALNTEQSRALAAEGVLQTQITAVETGAGLSGTGGYIVPTGSNYLSTTTSLAGADAALDAQVKVNTDAIAAINTTAIPNVQAQLTSEVNRATSAESTLSNSLSSAVSTLNTAISTEQTRATGAETTLTTNLSNEVTRATGVEGGLQTQVNALVASAGAGAAALKTELNTSRYTYISTVPALTHTVQHNLNTQFYSATIMVQGTDGVWRNDIMPVQDLDLNSYQITLTESSNVKASGQSNAQL